METISRFSLTYRSQSLSRGQRNERRLQSEPTRQTKSSETTKPRSLRERVSPEPLS